MDQARVVHRAATTKQGLEQEARGRGARSLSSPNPSVTVTRWLTGYSQDGLEAALAAGIDYATFFAEAPALNPARDQVTGRVCGVKVQEVEDPLMRLIRILDKLVDELAKGKALERICRA